MHIGYALMEKHPSLECIGKCILNQKAMERTLDHCFELAVKWCWNIMHGLQITYQQVAQCIQNKKHKITQIHKDKPSHLQCLAYIWSSLRYSRPTDQQSTLYEQNWSPAGMVWGKKKIISSWTSAMLLFSSRSCNRYHQVIWCHAL